MLELPLLPGLVQPPLPQRLMVRAVRWLSEHGLGDAILRRAVRSPALLNRPFGRHALGPGDVVVSTYFKSGTNWMLQLALQTAWAGQARFTHVHQLVPWPDAPTPLPARVGRAPRSPSGLQIIKTHTPRSGLPLRPGGGDGARSIVVARDPKAVVVSAYHFVLGVLGNVCAGEISPEAWLDRFCSRQFIGGSWAEHAASWWPHRDDPDVLWVTFREMKADLAGAQRRVEAFLEVQLDEQTRAEVLRMASFQHMKAHTDAFGSVGPILRGRAPDMVRAGRVSSGELYRADQLARVDAWCRAELARLGSDLPYDALFGQPDG